MTTANLDKSNKDSMDKLQDYFKAFEAENKNLMLPSSRKNNNPKLQMTASNQQAESLNH